jgi:amidohydrolase
VKTILTFSTNLSYSFQTLKNFIMKKIAIFIFVLQAFCSFAQNEKEKKAIDKKANEIESQVIAWRRHLHQNPELSNRETETGKYIAKYLKTLPDVEVRENVANTGVVAIIKGEKPGPVVALRADIDALPVTERANLPFASKVKTNYNGQEVGVMHACGHDTHVAMLMGAATVLSGMKKDIQGTVVFLFQPAEEGAPPGEEAGAFLMIKQGVLDNPKVEAAFGLHIGSGLEVNKLEYKTGGMMAASDVLKIKVKGKQTHGASPWGGIDPIVVSAQIVMGLQTIISRQTDVTNEAAVITIGKINGGVRNNIIPESCEMEGTIRTLDAKMRDEIHARIKKTATNIAEASGAEAEVEIISGYPIVVNSLDLARRMIPTMEQCAGGEDNVRVTKARLGAEDFAYFAQKVPALFMSIGGREKGKTASEAFPHHTPDFYIDESGFKLGVRAFCYFVMDYPVKK